MAAQILDGKHIADELFDSIKARVALRSRQGLPAPGLSVVLVGDDPASQIYVRNKERACQRCGVRSTIRRQPSTTTQEDLLAIVDALNADPQTHGILVQLPLPRHIDSAAVIARIDPRKDADGFHPENMGRLALGLPGLRPCTPRGIMTLLAHSGIELSGADAVIIGRSNIVGRPMALELLRADATITICHSRTRDLPRKVGNADVLIAAIGKPEFVQGDWIKAGAIVIDVGMNRLGDGRLVGDVDFDAARTRAGWITPVPGGVGPMTVASLLANTLDAATHLDAP